jgi:hypothetical protein
MMITIRKESSMNRVVGLTVIAGCALAASAAVRLLRGNRAVSKAESVESEIERFENEGGHAVPI